MNLRKSLTDFARMVADEADRNPDFASRVAAALGLAEPGGSAEKIFSRRSSLAVGQRPKNRRPAPMLDPIEVARLGESALRAQLTKLSIGQLKDIVAEFGMDPGKLVIKWKTADRIIERIVEISLARSQKGDAFRGEGKTRGGSGSQDVQAGEIDYRGYRLAPIQEGDAWQVHIRAVTATSMPPATTTMKFSDRESALANAKENLDMFLQGKWR